MTSRPVPADPAFAGPGRPAIGDPGALPSSVAPGAGFPADPADRPSVVVLTSDEQLAERILTLAAVAGVVLDRPSLPVPGRRPPPSWSRAPLVLVGADVADPAAAGHPQRLREVAARGSVAVVTTAPAHTDLWRRAVELGADHVVLLPDGEPWLLDRLLDAASGPPSGCVLGVVGGRGGAGASTLAVALALAGVRRRLRTVLVDGDPLGGGLDLLLGAETNAGLRWPDLADLRGRMQPGLLTSACVTVDDLRLVSWGAGRLSDRTAAAGSASPPAPTVSAEAMVAVLDAAGRESDLAVVDLPRCPGPAEAVALETCRTVVLVVPAEVRAAAAAAPLAARVGEHVTDLRLVVRGPAPTGLPAEAVADLLGLPLAAALSPEPGLAAALDRGEAAAIRPRGALGRFATRLVTEVVAG